MPCLVTLECLHACSCEDMESGLLGRTLLTLVPNKPGPMPSHRLGPHDLVDVRPNKGDASGTLSPVSSALSRTRGMLPLFSMHFLLKR